MKSINILVYLLMLVVFKELTFDKEDILIKNGEIELPGTLTNTNNSSKIIIWIHGSGNIDRNGNQAGLNINANYIQQFREEINKKDIAFFSYDKRTANPKNRKFLTDIKFDDLVSDAKSVVSYFKKKKEYEEIILVGHSQGSLVAMLASSEADKLISLAGPGEGIDQTIIKQVTARSSELGKIASSHVKELKESGTIKEVNMFLAAVFAKANHSFLSNWFQYNPVTEISKIKIPTLILNGDKDFQVKAEDAKNLKNGKPDAELKIIKNMNHVLKTVTSDSDNRASYTNSNFPISVELVNVISEFINK